jgi:HlyD family secretion protein
MTNFEIRTEELDAILGKTPSRLIIYSTSVILGFVIIILVGTMLFPYPEKIDCKFIITSSNPPIQIFSQASGQISLYVKDKEIVKKEQILAYIINPAELQDVLLLENLLDSLTVGNAFDVKSVNRKLGELTPAVLELEKSLTEYYDYIKLDLIPQKILSLNRQLHVAESRKEMLISQLNIYESDLELIKKQYNRDSLLFVKGTIPAADLEVSKSYLYQKQNAYIEADIICKNNLTEIEQIQSTLLDLKTEHWNQMKNFEDNILRNTELLQNLIKDWKKKYVFVSPYNGITSFSVLWSDNQWVNLGDPIMTILPENEEKIIGRMGIPIQRSGKVQINQDIVLKLSNYPYMEYGVLYGKIKSISLVPYQENYIAEIEIPSLITNYKDTIPFNQQMEGTASIIVKDVSLFERLLQPVISSIYSYKRH